eukprot:CAMPEP_0170650910 /NCGR_PEP_ID=MMETSP0224-20130122/46065_1 /TAXON_ID=285029 /ORGANISM="Togula jolla, Strain CCCM 725" /LENGTH=157 /DNA_ID=CAMNT_0010982625 /DNA_START=764 /DNA_END=1238 /DNA_ORIENTATION=+
MSDLAGDLPLFCRFPRSRLSPSTASLRAACQRRQVRQSRSHNLKLDLVLTWLEVGLPKLWSDCRRLGEIPTWNPLVPGAAEVAIQHTRREGVNVVDEASLIHDIRSGYHPVDAEIGQTLPHPFWEVLGEIRAYRALRELMDVLPLSLKLHQLLLGPQ